MIQFLKQITFDITFAKYYSFFRILQKKICLMATISIEIGVNHPNHLILRNLDKHVIIIITYRWKFFKNHSLKGERIKLYDLIVNLWK